MTHGLYCTWSHRNGLPAGLRSRFRDLDDYLRTLASSAKSRLLMVSPYLSASGMGSLRGAIATSAQRGAWIRLVTSDLDRSGTTNRRAIAALLKGEDGDLIRERLRVLKVSRSALLNGLIHAKCIVVDGKRGYLGSANFSTRGLERNLELGVALSTEEAAALDELMTRLEAHGDLDDCTSNITVSEDRPSSNHGPASG